MTYAKLTVKVPSDLHRQAKAATALRGDTLTEVINRALGDYVAEMAQLFDEIAGRIATGQEEIYDWDEVKEHLKEPDQEEAVPA